MRDPEVEPEIKSHVGTSTDTSSVKGQITVGIDNQSLLTALIENDEKHIGIRQFLSYEGPEGKMEISLSGETRQSKCRGLTVKEEVKWSLGESERETAAKK